MYPGLTTPLVVILTLAFIGLGWLLVRQPVLRRLAMRQVTRRRTEAILVVSGSMLGTAIIVGALVVGDTLGFSVRQTAYHTLGPIDERVVSAGPGLGAQVAGRLAGLSRAADVDGVLNARLQQSSAVSSVGGHTIAEPRTLAWDVDFAAAGKFGAAAGSSGLGGAAPSPGHVVINQPLAVLLHAHVGGPVTLFLAGRPQHFLVSRVVAEAGLAGTGLGATQNLDAFLPPGTLTGRAAAGARSVTWVSNRGGVQDGDALTSTVTAQIRGALGPLANKVAIETPKKDVLLAASKTGDSLGSLFLMIGSFSIIAGALLLVNIFVMLAEERKGQLGMLRAAGLKRSRLVAAFTAEGAVYAVVATIFGVGLGVGVGRVVAFLAARIFSSWSTDGSGLDVQFALTSTSLINGAALGLVISLLTILATSVRISRFNIIAAIRDLEASPTARNQRRTLIASSGLALVFAIASVPAVAASRPVPTFLWPSLAALCATPLLTRAVGKRLAYSTVSTAVLAWVLLVNVIRPKVFDSGSLTVNVVLGSLLAFSAVVLVSENQNVLLWPVRRLIMRPTERALAARLAVAYPVAKRFRTGATLIMYTLIMLVLVLLTEIGGVLTKSIDTQVANSTAGYAMRVDFNPSTPGADPLTVLGNPRHRDDVRAIAPLTSAAAQSTDPGHRSTEPIDTILVGVQPAAMRGMQFDKRLAGLATDTAVWTAIATHSNYVALDPFFGATGGPAGQFYKPGDSFMVTDVRTGLAEQKTIVGILRNATVFYSPVMRAAFPVVTSAAAVTQQFGAAATTSSALVRTGPGVPVDQLAGRWQGEFLSASLVATPVASTIRRLFQANVAFFRLMEGFLALGLLIGISGLGVVMVRAVRERRRTIGILRALGFRSRIIELSFILESGFVALEGVVLGASLGIVTTWLMYQKSSAFNGTRAGFPVMWGTAALIALVTVIASLLATAGPAHRASRILPALATRATE